MKKMETKKIGAVLGAALLASSAFGAVSFGNTELVNMNGQVVATVVVGEKASISDGVAAAKIASMLASKAYKSTTLKAEVLGKEGVTCSATGGNATCQVVDKSVDLTVIMPGLTSNQVVNLQPLIAEDLDLELGDRHTLNDELDDYFKLWDDRAHPFSDQNGQPGTPYAAAVIDYKNYDGFKIVPVTGRSITGIQEKQRVLLAGYSEYSDNQIKFKLNDAIYQVIFGSNDYGLPLCPGDPNKQYGNCTQANKLPSSRAAIQFMGETWYITKVDIPTYTSPGIVDKQVYQITNTEVHLAKEARYGVISVGEFLETEDGQYRVVLDDINKNDLLGNPAIISIVDRNNNTITQDQITPGETKRYTLGGKDVFVHVYQTAPGTVQLAKWAEMAIIKDSIVLKDGDNFLQDSNTQYVVRIGLTLKGGASSGTDVTATHLKDITIYGLNLNEELQKGQSYKITDVPGYQAFELSYQGLTDPGFVTIRATARNSVITLNSTAGTTLNEYIQVDVSPSSYPVRVPVDTDSGGTSLSGTPNKYVTTLYLTQSASIFNQGDVIVKDGPLYYADTSTLSYVYRPLGNLFGSIDSVVFGGNVGLWMTEDVGKVSSIDSSGQLYVRYSSSGPKLLSQGGNDDEVTYNSPVNGYGYTSGWDHYQTTFITLRGTEVTGNGATRTFKVPLEVRRLNLLFKSTKQGNVSPNEYKLAGMREGETRDVPGSEVKVRVDAIKCQTQVVGSMSGTAMPNLDSLRAEIFDGTVSRGSSTQVLVPAYTGSNYPDIVKLDKEVTAGTMVLVGGPRVNSKTAEVMQSAQVQLSPSNRVVVQEVATGKIIVAGWEAEDTLQAVSQFLNQLRVS
jgi:hypothetical protein